MPKYTIEQFYTFLIESQQIENFCDLIERLEREEYSEEQIGRAILPMQNILITKHRNDSPAQAKILETKKTAETIYPYIKKYI